MKLQYYKKIIVIKFVLIATGILLALLILIELTPFTVQIHTPIFFIITLLFVLLQFFESRIKSSSSTMLRIEHLDIYEKIKDLIGRTREELLICSPTFKFGSYTYGTKVTGEVQRLIKRVLNEGKTIRLVIDINSTASALDLYSMFIRTHCKLKCRFHETDDFFFIRDKEEMITSEEPLIRQGIFEGGSHRTVKLIPDHMLIEKGEKHIADKVLIFERYWQEGVCVKPKIRHFVNIQLKFLGKIKEKLKNLQI